MIRVLSLFLSTALVVGVVVGQEPRVRTYNDKDFFFTPPTSKAEWEKRREMVKARVLVANGLWPTPPKTPLKPVIHGKIERDGYTVEKVFFASLPGHYVSGNLYRPTGAVKGKRPAILNPHGHWANGRLFEANAKEIERQMKGGGEKTENGAKYPLQARCAQLARMGCVVFHFDMVGYADSATIPHRQGFLDADAELRLQSFMGLQTWNCVRALDFLSDLPDVDPARIGVTGASGGGTQTFILAAVDDRPAVAVPAVMVGTAMQGGCICENCSYLRVGLGNVEIAGCFAPKPLALIGANDWTVDIEKKGYPELKALFKLYGVEENVFAKCFPEYGHNYNQTSREVMYNWFNKQLHLGQSEPVREREFVPVPPKDLRVYDETHPRPQDSADAATLRRYLTTTSDTQIEALKPTDAKSLAEYRRVIGTALKVMTDEGVPTKVEVKVEGDKVQAIRPGPEKEGVTATLTRGKGTDGSVIVWVGPASAVPAKATVLRPEITTKAAPLNKDFAGYTWGYNRPLVARQVREVLTAVAAAKSIAGTKPVHLVGVGELGPVVLLARAVCGDSVARTAVDVNQFRFEKVRTLTDPMLLPGALKYGGLGAFAGLIAPHELFCFNQQGSGTGQWLETAYTVAGAKEKLRREAGAMTPEKVAEWVLR